MLIQGGKDDLPKVRHELRYLVSEPDASIMLLLDFVLYGLNLFDRMRKFIT